MSHFTKVKTAITDLAAFQRACDAMGLKYEIAEAGKTLSYREYFGGTRNDAALVIRKGQAGKYAPRFCDVALIADPEHPGQYQIGVDSMESELTNRMLQRYAYEIVMAVATQQGQTVVDEEVQPDGSIKLTLRYYATSGGTENLDVEAEVTPEGMVQATTKGYKGDACLPMIRTIQQAMGGEVLTEKPTDDFYDPGMGGGVMREDWQGDGTDW